MRLKRLNLVNYKNLSLDLDLDPGINLIIAPNGTGKTNLLEAIDYVSQGLSFRGIEDEYVFPEGKNVEFSMIELELEREGLKNEMLKLVFTRNQGKNYFIDGMQVTSRKFKARLKTLVHAPNSLDIVSSSAKLRRDFLDQALRVISTDYVRELRDYNKVVANKNKLLQNIREEGFNAHNTLSKQLQFWNEKLVELGSKIAAERYALLELLLPLMSEIAKDIYNLDAYEITFAFESRYIPELAATPRKDLLEPEIKRAFVTKVTENYEKEVRAGLALYGPHRDDLNFFLNGKSIRFSASRGQQRIFSLILHLALMQLIESEFSQKIVLLFDDILSELDQTHRTNTFNYMKEVASRGNQILLTLPDKNMLNMKQIKSVHTLSII